MESKCYIVIDRMLANKRLYQSLMYFSDETRCENKRVRVARLYVCVRVGVCVCSLELVVGESHAERVSQERQSLKHTSIHTNSSAHPNKRGIDAPLTLRRSPFADW